MMKIYFSLLSGNGYLGLGINEKYGGSGEDLYDLGILFERLGYHAAPLSLSGCLVDVAQTIQKFVIATHLATKYLAQSLQVKSIPQQY